MTTPIIARTVWASTPAASPEALIDPGGLAVHWIGPKVPANVYAGDKRSVALFLEAIRRFHVNTHGWSDIAYQWAVDTQGRRWACRGWRRRSAANGDTVPNARFGAVVALIGQGQEPTPELLEGLADARAHFRKVHPSGRQLLTHNQVRPEPTACPGPELTRWVERGGPRPSSPPPPPALLDPTEEAAMVLIVHPNGSAYHLTAKGLVWLEAGEVSRITGTQPTKVHVDKATWEAYRDAYGVLKAE